MPILKKITFLILEKIKKSPIISICFIFALSLHIALILIAHHRPYIPHTPNRQKLIVNTHLVPSSSFSTTTKKQAQIKSSLNSSSKAQTTSVSEKKPTAKGTKTPIKKVQQANTTKQLSNEQAKQLLKELQKSLAEIETIKEVVHEKKMLVPQSIKELKADDYEITSDVVEKSALDYHTLLIGFLKDALQLPAYGTVKVVLTLNPKGEFKDLEILASDSEVNRFFLEKQLKELQYPVFTKDLSHTSTYSFNLTFCSDQ